MSIALGPILLLAVAGCLSSSPRAKETSKPTTATARAASPAPSPSGPASPSARADPSLPNEAPVAVLSAHPAQADFVGDAACMPCHGDIARSHRRTRHAATLHAVSVASDGTAFERGQTVWDPLIEAAYRPSVRGNACAITLEGAGREQVTRARFALGSGRYAVSYLGTDESGEWSELRISDYPALKSWDFTPQMQPDRTQFRDPGGLHLDRRQVPACLSCHATTLRMGVDGPDLAHSRLGIGCERCHGPARAHISAMRAELAGHKGQSMGLESLKQATQTRLTAQCGDCHQGPPGLPTDPGHADVVARFASTAFERSRCYQATHGFSCVSCHDPHSDAATGPRAARSYEAVCLSCHRGGSAAVFPTKSVGFQVTAAPRCRVNPTHDCVRCHLSAQTTREFQHVVSHNHWIRIWNRS